MLARLICVLTLIALVLASFATPVLANNPSPAQAHKSVPAEQQAKTEILVRFRQNITAEQRKSLVQAQGGQIVKELPELRIQVISVPEQALTHVLAAMQHNPNVESAEINSSYQITRTPNDPYYPQQWGPIKMRVPYAWDATVGSSSVVIAIIDTGVTIAHPEFANKIVKPWSVIDSTTNVRDDQGHGTSVASAAAALGNNARGLAGMCWNCMIMPVKVFGPTGGASFADIATGIIYAANNGADVINLSLVGSDNSFTANEAIQYANSKGVVVIAAAGNTGSSGLMYPAAFDNVIAVAAIQSDGKKYSFSTYGSWVEVSAPGCGIVATGATGYNTTTFCGTSYAAPLVAGVAGLIMSRYPNASLAAIRAALLNTTTAITAGTSSKGMVNAQTAVSYSYLPNPSVTAISPTQWSNLQPLRPTITATFSRPVSNLTSTTVALRQQTTGAIIPAALSYSSTTLQAKLTPNANLQAGTSYYVDFSNAIKDAAGNTLTAYRLNFTTAWADKAGDQSFSPARTVRVSVGSHTGYRFNAAGAIGITKTATVAVLSDVSSSRRQTIPGQTGTWLYITSGTYTGYFLKETSGSQYVLGLVGQSDFAGRRITFAAGTYIGYKYNTTTGAVTYSKKGTLAATSSATTTATAIINGRTHYYIYNGIWIGYWMPAGSGVSLGAYLDTTKPVVSAQTPTINAINVATDAAISVTFNEPVVGVSSSSVTLLDASNAPVAVAVTYDSATRKATVNHSSLLEGTTYTLQLSAAIKDASTNSLTATAWSFTTADTTSPTLSALSPADEASNVPLNATPSALFSEPVAGVSSSSVRLIETATGLIHPASVSYNTTTRALLLTPSLPLLNGIAYSVVLDDSLIKDAAGRLLLVPGWQFTTAPALGDTTTPVTTFASPTSFTPTSLTSFWALWSGSDEGSGIKDYQVILQQAPITAPGACSDSWTNLTDFGRMATNAKYVTDLATDTCYRVAVRGFDNAGNVAAFTYSGVVLVDTTGS